MKRYSNPNTKGSPVRGFEALSQKTGQVIWDEILLHDDGQIGFGGTRTFGVGGQGSGKTTLNSKIARLSYYIDQVNKNEFFEALGSNQSEDWIKEFGKFIHPETVLWRGREFDIWNVLAADNFKKYYPREIAKPLCIHVYKNSNLEFYEHCGTTGEIVPLANLDVRRYINIDQLYKNLVEGGNNVIYPPIKHYMSPRLKDSINVKRNMSKHDRKYLSPNVGYLVERDVFLFEIFEYLYRRNIHGDSRKWFTAVIDESHDLFRAGAPDIYYWIIECMVDVLVDTRKNNISLACMTHALNLIDWRILERASHFIWLRGAKPTPAYSNVDIRLIKKLKDGQGVNEAQMTGHIGGFLFDRVPDSIPRLTVEGMVDTKDLSSYVPDDDFEGITDPVNDGGVLSNASG